MPSAANRISLRSSGQESSLRPHRQSIFNNPGWPPAPECAPPTPSGLRLARAVPADHPSARSPSPPGHCNASHSKPVLTSAAITTQSKTNDNVHMSNPNHRAQQMQARALAAQAAHQQRVSAAAAAAHVINPHPSPLFGKRSNGDMIGFGGARAEPKLPAPAHCISPLANPTDPSDNTPTPALAYPSLNNSSADNAEIVESRSSSKSHRPAEASHPPEPVRFTSPTASVDISAFLPAPGPPVLIANEATIAASAVPLSDWAAELLWMMGTRRYNPTEIDSGRWIQSVLSTRSPLRPDSVQLDSFKAFVNQTLSATLASPQGLILGLYFVSKLPIGTLQSIAKLNADAPSSAHALFATLSPVLSWTSPESAFRQILHGSGEPHLETSDQVTSQLVFVLSLMLSNKWLEDNTFTTKTWHDVTGLPQSQLKDLETSALRLFNFSLFVHDRQWFEFLNVLRSYTSNLVAREPIGETSNVNRFALGRIDELLNIAQEAKAPSPLYMKQAELGLEKEILAMGRASLVLGAEDNVILSRDSTLPPSHHQERHCRSASFPTSVMTVPQWDMLLDSPLTCSRHHVQYEAVQRPFDQYCVSYTATTLRSSVQDPIAYIHAMDAHKQPYAPQRSHPHHVPFARSWHPSQAPSTFNAPHPSHLNMSRPDVNVSSHRFLDASLLPYPPSQHVGLIHPGHNYASQFLLNGQTHCGPLDLVEPGWVSQLGFAAQAFVAGSGARIRT